MGERLAGRANYMATASNQILETQNTHLQKLGSNFVSGSGSSRPVSRLLNPVFDFHSSSQEIR